MFFRRGVSDDQWLQAKLWLFSFGAILALLGIGLRNDWLIAGAALALLAGMALRFIPRRGGEEDDEPMGPGTPPGPPSDS